MDSSHVSLVALKLKASGFDEFRCDRNISYVQIDLLDCICAFLLLTSFALV